ncbi:MAG: hypothetical protein QOF82_1348 [Frankiales bacterium]|nr:hypothetical protein [Frankiales bacterium]MDX6208903.1 hypothetical protein [Frankiales bacterium]MDX6212261.1 hypothetical protein [Frankiales bacterium]MDX6222098.1 hypothetical protein [Frankiales bacterium]
MDEAVTPVAPREPCPCGSGRRYKACHGREQARAADPVSLRPFAGLTSEAEWVALREIVPAATAALKLRDPQYADREVLLATVLPMGCAAMVRADHSVFLGLQVAARSGDVSRDIAHALEQALVAPAGTPISASGLPGPGASLQDLVTDDPLEVTVLSGFDFWVEGVGELDPEVQASLERANSVVIPTAKVDGAEAAYWCRMPERNHLRWILPYDEELLLDAMARLMPSGGLSLGEGTKYVGSFRAHGLLVPVWDLPSAMPADQLEQPVAELQVRLDEALADETTLTSDQRRARGALLGRQLTIR